MKSPTWSTNKTERNILKCCRHALHSFVKNQHLRPTRSSSILGLWQKANPYCGHELSALLNLNTNSAWLTEPPLAKQLYHQAWIENRNLMKEQQCRKKCRKNNNIQNVWMNIHNQGIIQQFIYCHMAYCALAYLYYKIKHNIDKNGGGRCNVTFKTFGWIFIIKALHKSLYIVISFIMLWLIFMTALSASTTKKLNIILIKMEVEEL